MNTLIDGGLPYEIDGVPISPDFRNMLRVEAIAKEEKRHVLEMRKHFAIKQSETERKSVEQIEKETHDYYERRIALAKEKQQKETKNNDTHN